MRCLSCNISLKTEEGYSMFKCPVCNEQTVLRCEECRKNSRTYLCKCGFEGP